MPQALTDRVVRWCSTLGFTLAKGLVRGLTRCPNPSEILVGPYCPFSNVCSLAIDTLLDGSGRMSVVVGGWP